MKKKTIISTTIIILLIIGVYCSNVKAENTETLEEQRDNIQNQLNEANQQIEQIEIKITEALEQIDSLNSRIDTYESQLNELNINLYKLYQDIDTVEIKLKHVEEDYERQKNSLEQRLVALYESGETNYLDFLLSSNSLSEFVSNYFLISEITAYDVDLLDNIEREKNTIDNIKQALEEKKTRLKQLKDSREKTIISLENTKIIKNSYMKQLTSEELATQEKIDTYRQELSRIETEILLIATGNIGTDYVGGIFAWPAPGYTTVTSTYGMRLHPIFKIYRMHSGTDIGMSLGASIVAANGGVVVKAEYTNGYGNMVMLDHGGGIMTVYGHGSEILVKVGQTVERGEVIMKAGSTGWSTGPHLHFEVRINGTCVDSLPYITGQTSSTTQTDSNTNPQD